MSSTDTHAPATIEIVPFEAAHMPGAHVLSQAESWPHRPQDWGLGLSVSRGVVALQDGRVVGTALCSIFGPVATLNMIIVADDMRGRGLGRKLMNAAMAYADGLEMRLVATEAGRPLYRKLGFVECGGVIQLNGIPHAIEPERSVSFGSPDLERMVEIDREASGMDRGALLAAISSKGEALHTDGGFALLRRFGRGHVLGPVVAKDPAAARALIAAGASRMAGRYLRIDVVEELGLAPFIESLGLVEAGSATSMVRSPGPRTPSNYLTHALVSQAFG